MSKTPNDKDDKSKSHRKTPAKDDEVGYKKPPKSGRFVKGQSGNPRGRPRKPKPQPPRLSDAPSESYLEQEAYRTIKLRENGREIELPVTQAVYRALITNAIKGSRLSAREFFKHLKQAEDEREKRKLDNYLHLQQLKREGEEILANCAKKGIEPPELIPHPEDIVLNRLTGEAYVNGPETPEDLKSYKATAALRDHCLLLAVQHDKHRKLQNPDDEGQDFNVYFWLAGLNDAVLPKRFRRQLEDDASLLSEYQGLTKRQLKRYAVKEMDRLKANEPQPQYLTLEIRQGLRQLVDEVFEGKTP